MLRISHVSFSLVFFFFKGGEGLKREWGPPLEKGGGQGKAVSHPARSSPPPPPPRCPDARTEAEGAALSRVWGGREDLFSKSLLKFTPSQRTNAQRGQPTSPVGEEGRRPFRALQGQISGTLRPSPARPPGRAAGTWSPSRRDRSGARPLAPPPGSYPPRAPAPAPPAAPALRAAKPPPRPARAPGLAPPSRLRQPHSGRQARGPKKGRTDAGPHPGYRIRLRPPTAASTAAAAAAAMS